MKKSYLINYETAKFHSLSSHDHFVVLIVKTVYFWGLFSMTKKHNCHIPYHHSIKVYFDLWDKQIATKEQLK